MIADALTLVRMDLLKLRRRRGLMAIGLLIAVGTVSILFAVNAVRHGANPQVVGPAGGLKTFQDATDFLGMIAVVVAALIGATAGAADSELGVLRDVVATGRSRTSLYASRAAAGALVTVALMAASLLVVTVCSVALAGSDPVPSLSEIVQRDAAVLGFAVAAALVCTGAATFTRSRGPVMASVIALGVVVSQVLVHVGFLGSLRDVLPLVAFERAAGDALSGLSTSLTTAIAVLMAWALVGLAAGGWWARRVEV